MVLASPQRMDPFSISPVVRFAVQEVSVGVPRRLNSVLPLSARYPPACPGEPLQLAGGHRPGHRDQVVPGFRVAIRVRARTLAYDSRPAANSRIISGKAPSSRATRTCSRAVPEAIWHFHDNHAAHEGISHDAQPPRASKSASGEVEGLKVHLAGAEQKLTQLAERATRASVNLGIPAYRDIAGRTVTATQPR
jgi:hypothetical protein